MNQRPAIVLAGLDDLSPVAKQLPFLVLYLAAAAMSAMVPTLVISNAPALVSGVVMAVTAMALALVFDTPALRRFATIVLAMDVVAVGLLRHGTGEGASVYSSLLLLPVLWFAAMEGRRYVVYAVLGVGMSTALPFLLGAQAVDNPNELARGLITAGVYAVAALVVNELALRARRHLTSVSRKAARASEELAGAAQIQRFLLPKESAILPGYETAGACVPSKAVGGDFFDWYAIDGGLGFTLGDVMGKGAGAGMIAATTRAVIRSARNSADPVKALMLTSDCLATELGEAAAFATLFHARLRAEDGTVLFSDAGHGLSLLVRANGTWERLTSGEMPVGLMPEANWTSRQITLAPGDMVVSISDGVLDLYDGTLAAIDEVAEIARAAASAQDVVDAVHELALATSNPDDVTVLAVRRCGPNIAGARVRDSGSRAMSAAAGA